MKSGPVVIVVKLILKKVVKEMQQGDAFKETPSVSFPTGGPASSSSQPHTEADSREIPSMALISLVFPEMQTCCNTVIPVVPASKINIMKTDRILCMSIFANCKFTKISIIFYLR